MLHPLHDVIAFGAELSSPQAVVEEAAASLGARISPDPMPEEVLLVRSDEHSFARQGVPSVFRVTGFDNGRSESGGRQQVRRWLRTTYHTPADDGDPSMNLETGARLARLNFLIGYLAAERRQRPEWNPGDFFARLFDPRRRSDAAVAAGGPPAAQR